MQNATSASQAPPAPASPAPPAAAASPAPQAVVQLDGVPLLPGVPRNPNEVQAMRARRSELSNQLNSAESRRDDLVGELSEVPASVQAGMQQRIELLDERILRIEGEIAETGRLLAASPAIAMREPRNQDQAGLDSDQITAISIVFLLFVLAPMAFAWARRILRKPIAAPPPTPLLMESAERLERLEHAVDAIAIEMERVSEGQRFVTRLLTKDSAAV